MNFLSQWWGQLPASTRAEVQSVWHTFLSAALVELGVQFTTHQDVFTTVAFTKGMLLAMLAAVIRAGVKAVFQAFVYKAD